MGLLFSIATNSYTLPRKRCDTAPKWAETQELATLQVADIHCAMNTGTRLFPLDLSGRDLNTLTLASVAVLNREEITTQDYGYSLKRIAMLRHSLARRKMQTAHHRGSVLNTDFVLSRWPRWNSLQEGSINQACD